MANVRVISSHLLVLTSLLLTLNIRGSTSLTPVTCSAPLSVIGQRTHVTCYFQEDVKASRKQVMVVWRRFGAPDSDLGQDVLACVWPVGSEKPACSVSEGFDFNEAISDRLRIDIPSASNETAGQYTCHVIPPDGTMAYSCPLAVEDNHKINAPRPLMASSDTTSNGKISLFPVIITAGVCCALILGNVVFVWRLRRQYRQRMRNSTKNPEDLTYCNGLRRGQTTIPSKAECGTTGILLNGHCSESKEDSG